MSGLVSALRSVPSNPVLRRELDVRARSRISAFAVSGWLLLLGGLTALVYYAYVGDADPGNTDNAEIGREIFHWTLFGMMSLVLFLVPAFTASSVAGERTRQTLIPVQMTSLGPLDIVLGKALAAIAFTVLLVVAAAPMLSVAFLVGGVTVADLLSGLGILLLTAVLLGSVGIMLSSVFRSVQAATVLTYGFVALIVIGSFIGLGVAAFIMSVTNDGFGSNAPPPSILAVNPFAGMSDAVADSQIDIFFGSSANPISGLKQALVELARERQFNVGAQVRGDTASVWRWYVVFCVMTTYVSLYVATNRLRTPAETER